MNRSKGALLAALILGLVLWIVFRPGNGSSTTPPSETESGFFSGAGSEVASEAAGQSLSQGQKRPEVDGADRVAQLVVTGQVTGERQEPIAGASVTFEPSGEPSSATAVAWSDDRGYYELALVQTTGWVRAAAAGHLAVRRVVDAKEPGRVLRDFVLPSLEAAVAGRVVEALSGTPVAGVKVIVKAAGRTDLGLRGSLALPADPERAGEFGYTDPLSDTSDSNGRFHIDAPAGSFSLLTRSDRHLEDMRYGRLEAGEVRTLELKVFVVDRMTLTVRDRRDNPVAGAVVNRSDGLMARTDAGGEAGFPLTPTTVDRRELRVQAAGYRIEIVELPSTQNSAEVTLRLGPQLFGRISDPNGDPIGGARIEPRGSRTGRLVADPVVYSDAAGTFSLHIGSPPLHQLEVTRPGFVPERLRADDDGFSGPLAIVLEPARGRLAGLARDSEGRPVRHFEVRLLHPTERGRLQQKATFDDPDGRFSMDVSPGVYRAAVYSRSPATYNWRSAPQLVSIPDRMIEEVELVVYAPPGRR